jgi:Tfp pilus assembly protein PilV
VKLVAALLIDIIQLGFLNLQPRLPNEMARYQRVIILLVVDGGLSNESIWASC